MKLIFASSNPGKIAELKAVLGKFVSLRSLQDIGCREELPETQNTLEGNALQKARYVHDKYGVDCFADDTGLEIDALNGLPGVWSARYAGPSKNAADNIRKVLQEMKGMSLRRARFTTIIALIINNKETLFEGIIEGNILEKPCGTAGFGYDPIFQPAGQSKSFAEMSPEEKNRLSHRAIAVKKLGDFLSRQQG